MPVGDAKWKDILCHLIHSADKCKPAYSNKLHNSRHAVDNCVITYLHVPGQLRVATDYYVVTNYAVMCNMAVREKHPIAAYHSGFSRLRRGVHCREFAEDISAANTSKRYGIAPILFVFGLCPQTCERMNFVVILKACMAADDNICAKHVAATEDYVRANMAMRANIAAVANDRARFDYRRGMNKGRHDALCKTLQLDRSRRATPAATPTNVSETQ